MSVQVTTTRGTMVSASTGSGTSVSLTSSSTSVSASPPAVNSIGVTSNPTVADKTKTHIQGVASSVWIVTHGLNKYPSVSVTDSAGTTVIGMIEYDSLNQVTLTFKSSFSGKVHFN
tara:strand:- start:277 stop:624 length:348 start_codon:yes stop_codon:yes gene_type:complete